MSWPAVKLHDICRPRQWKTISASNLLEEGYPVYGANGKIGFYSDYTHEFPTLMITCRGATCGNVHISEPKSYINGNAMALDELDREKVDIRFLYYYLLGRGFDDVISGSAQPQITGQGLTKIEIPLPPLPEQKRIAAILDKADAIRRKRQQAIQLADDFLRAVFLDMFGDPVTNPKGWDVKPLSAGIRSISSGWSASGENRPCSDGEKGVLKISAVTSGVFKPEENKTVPLDQIPDGKKLLFPKRGDLLFSRANTRELVAASCIVMTDVEDVFLPDKLWLIETDQKKFLPEFLNYLLWQPRFKERLTSQATGTSGSMLNISKSKFEETDAFFPNMELQGKFKRIYWALQEALEVSVSSRGAGDCLFESLSQKAFSGKL
ncbi:restriction endonuclease subunit S [Halopseudomonas aestusnigri]|uniref:restriction endonuclease subunit S n=1 Tax=Halopseudomonas aestusnigri TaxID=857252 RepID=UPI000C981EEB|nr:restriction endonuclease subunit S [Halopseudomonas aestusnigri]MAK73552.1 restriction endonuclease subunit S [Pseudomonadales bacterium]MAP77471.1 restriction endonuclease subunit S [Pseudomonadales bacterium]UGV30788.1 restriction endonuclease subunit S [Halopseudomonas aestusnigri]